MRKHSRAILPLLLLALFFSFGCAKKHTYITPNGKVIETSDIGLQTLAIRDQNIASETSFNDAIKGASDFQSFALTVNKLTQKGQQIEREPTWSEEGRAWAGLFLRYFASGIDVNTRRRTEVHSQVYNIHGNGNNMSGINNQATSNQGKVAQTLSSSSAPYEANQEWIQDGTQGSANGSATATDTDKESAQ